MGIQRHAVYNCDPLPAKVSSANLERSYRRAPKGPGDQDFGAGGAGICHLCACGLDVDWEDLPLKVYLAIFWRVLLGVFDPGWIENHVDLTL